MSARDTATATADKRRALGTQTSANVVRSAGVQLLSLSTTLIDRVVLTGVLIRHWGTDGFADWTTILAAAGVIVAIELGFQQLVGNQLLRSHVKNRHATFNQIMAWSLFTSLALGLLATAAVLGVAVAIDLERAFGLRSEGFAPALILMCIWSAIRVARGPILQAYRGLAEYYNFIWADVRATLIATLVAITAVVLGADAVFVALIYLVTTLIFSVWWSWRDLAQRFPFLVFSVRRPPRHVAWQTVRSMRWYALFFVLTNVMQAAPILIIAFIGMPGTLLATFAVQRTLVNFARTTSYGLSSAAGAELSVLKLSGNADAFERGLLALGRLNACLAAFAVVGLLAFNDDIVSLWTGRGDLGSQTILLLLLVPAVVVAPALGLQMASVMLDRIREQALAYALYAAIGLIGGAVLAQRYGIVGIAAAVAVGETLAIGCYAPWRVAREFGLSYPKIVAHALGVFLVVMGWASAVAWTIKILPEPAPDLSQLLAPTLWAAIAAPPALWLCMPAGMREKTGTWLSKATASLRR